MQVRSSSPTSTCSCNFSTVWVDVVVVLDSSQASTSIGFAEMWGLATQFLGRLTIQKSDYTNSVRSKDN